MTSITITLPAHVERDIRQIVADAPVGYETGVSLFGIALGDRRIVLAAVGPGPRAKHSPVFYEPDEAYANAAFDALGSALPGISWIGEFHVHPSGMTWLSAHDRETMRKLLAASDLNLTDFVAGILQRRRDRIDIYPYYFSRAGHTGTAILLEMVPSSHDIVREARRRAGDASHEDPQECAPEEHTDETSELCQRWLARVVNICRRNTI